MVSVDTYATLSFPTFIMCPYQCEQLWTVTDSPSCNPNWPVPIVTTVITNSARTDHVVTAIPQFHLHASIHIRPRQVYIILLLLGEGDRFPNPQNTHTHCITAPGSYPLSSLPRLQLSSAWHIHPLPRQLSSTRLFFLIHSPILMPECLRPTPHWCS